MSSVCSVHGHRIGPCRLAGRDRRVNDRWQLPWPSANCAPAPTAWLLNGYHARSAPDFIDVTVHVGRDVTLYRNDSAGRTVVGNGCEIGPDVRLVDCCGGRLRGRELCRPRSEIGAGAHVGPYAHLPAGSSVAAGQTTALLHCLRRLIRDCGASTWKVTTSVVALHRATIQRCAGVQDTCRSNSATRTSSNSPTARSARVHESVRGSDVFIMQTTSMR